MIELDQKGQEKKKHGNQDLPFAIYDINLGKMQSSITAHWHKEIEIIVVTSGSFQLQINTQVFSCKEGDILIINPEELHYFKTMNGEYATWKTLIFDVGQLYAMPLDRASRHFVQPIMNGTNQFVSSITPMNEVYDRIYSICSMLIEAYDERYYGFELEIKSFMFNFFGVLYRYGYIKEKVSNTPGEQLGKVKVVIDYISHHYIEQITMEELANLCHYNTEYFMRFFKKHTGITCGQFIKSYRLEQAAYMLQTTIKPITQIALDVGFSNVSYFIRSFKEYYHITPREFRKI